VNTGTANTPGASHTLNARAFGFASTFKLRELGTAIQREHEGVEIHQDSDRDRLVLRFTRAPQAHIERLAILYDFGAVVFTGMEPPEQEHVIRTVTAQLAPEPHAPLTEDFLIEVRPGAPVQVEFERVIVPEASLQVLDLVGLLLAQSVAMDYYEEDVQEILGRTDSIIQGLQTAGRIPGRLPDLVRFIGSCIATRNAIIAALALFDKPDSTWEHRELDRLFNGLRHELEIDDRFRALEVKLRMIQENLVLLADISRHRSTWRLEMAVVLLILFEVVIMLWQMFRGGAAH
jgi:uncharacterized Rmd1/YagE family protein